MSEITRFSVWEHIKTEEMFDEFMKAVDEEHVAALRQARIEALEEAAKDVEESVAPKCDCSECTLLMGIADDIRALKDKQP